MTEKKIKDYIKKVDFGDVRVLLVGIVLLIVPLLFLYSISGSGKSRKFSQQRMKTMVNRKSIFNFSGGKKAPMASAGNRKADTKASTGWFESDTPEKKVQRELESAFKVVQRSRRSERFLSGMSSEQKSAYRAEHNPFMTEGNGELENGNLARAELLFQQAYDEANGNIFQKVYALGGLCEVYSKMGNQKKYEQAFRLFMEMVGQMPKNAGGGDLKALVRNAYMTLKQLKDSADPGKVSQELGKVDLVKNGKIQGSSVSRGLSKALAVFPAKFD